MEEQLMRPYEMFKQYYPDMMYVPDNIQIWSMTNEEYGEAYCKACHILGISCENLKTAAGDEAFCAEVLKSDGKAIILINSVYRERKACPTGS